MWQIDLKKSFYKYEQASVNNLEKYLENSLLKHLSTNLPHNPSQDLRL